MTRSYIGFIEDDAVASTMEPPNVSVHNLISLAKALNVPEQEMLDRGYKSPPGFKLVPTGLTGAKQLVREKMEKYSVAEKLDQSELDDLSSELEDFACVRLERRVRQFQSQGSGKRQLQTQG